MRPHVTLTLALALAAAACGGSRDAAKTTPGATAPTTTAPGAGTAGTPGGTATTGGTGTTPDAIFPADDPWNTDVSAAAVDPASATLLAGCGAAALHPDFRTVYEGAPIQVLIRAMQTYGLILADNGSPWYVSGAPDARWVDDDLSALKRIKSDDFEVLSLGAVVSQ